MYKIDVLFVCVFYVTQYDDFEDSDGVTSEGKSLHTGLDLQVFISYHFYLIFMFICNSKTFTCGTLRLLSGNKSKPLHSNETPFLNEPCIMQHYSQHMLTFL